MSILSRRTLVAAAATLPALAVPGAANAAAVAEPDPIFAAIEEYRKGEAEFVALCATLSDVRALIEKHLPKDTRAKETWQHVETQLKAAAISGDTAQISIALQTVLQLESVEYRLK